MDVVRPFVPIVGGLGFLIIGLKMASTGSTGLMHSYHLLGVLPQDRERLGRTVGLCLAVTGAGALLAGIPSLIGHGEACFGIAATGAAVSLAGCGAGVVALFYFQPIRPWGFKK